MLARHGWRKLAPDTAHPQGDAALREDRKKLKKLSGKTLDAFCKCYFHHGDSNHIFGSAGQDLEVL
ncbi:hypothetical protein [Nitrosomonas sp. Nm58]|uniref:hypothetical protein n=1 Tax=Nitrosomonas sp. Nm58 TaxID=200126 RepID=UPI000897F793|nr:hypothetical protein [Nitrosomonas sp. Nm58]SDY85776.1 hypothetical protein SAMN05421754_102610 [Nitrosomonas sp. Nm58]